MEGLSEAHAYIHERTVTAARRVEQAVLPIVGVSNRQRPEVVGSGVLVTLPPYHFLITAGHVATDASSALYLSIDSTPAELTEPFVATRSIGASVKEPDVAFIRLNDEIASRVGSARFLTKESIAPWSAGQRGRHALIVGFPSSKSRANPHDNTLRHEIFRYSSLVTSPERLTAVGYDPRFHFGVDFDRDWSVLNTKKTLAPKPIGLSGCGVFGFQSLGLAGVGDPLVGITTTWRREDPLCLVATDIGIVMQGIFAAHPECDFRQQATTEALARVQSNEALADASHPIHDTL